MLQHRVAVFSIPFSLRDALKQSELINCRQCGRCEKKAKRVFITQEDIEKIAEYLNTISEVVRSMMHIEGEHMIMPCPFYKNECTVYPARPITCRIFPLFQHPDGRLGVSLDCPAGIDMHNLIQGKIYASTKRD